MPRLARPVVRLRMRGIMAHVPHRPALAAPVRQQARDLRLGLGIVALAPAGMIDGLLQVDQQQHGAGRGKRGRHGRTQFVEVGSAVREAWLGMRSTASVPGRSGEGRSTTAWFCPPAPRLGRSAGRAATALKGRRRWRARRPASGWPPTRRRGATAPGNAAARRRRGRRCTPCRRSRSWRAAMRPGRPASPACRARPARARHRVVPGSPA